MRQLALLALAAGLAMAAGPGVDIYSAKQLQEMGGKLSQKRTQFASENLVRYGNHYTMLAYREATGSSEVHEHEADIFVVESGEATIVTGGKVVDPHTEKPGEIRGKSIEGGERHQLGDRRHYPHSGGDPASASDRERKAVHLLRGEGDWPVNGCRVGFDPAGARRRGCRGADGPSARFLFASGSGGWRAAFRHRALLAGSRDCWKPPDGRGQSPWP